MDSCFYFDKVELQIIHTWEEIHKNLLKSDEKIIQIVGRSIWKYSEDTSLSRVEMLELVYPASQQTYFINKEQLDDTSRFYKIGELHEAVIFCKMLKLIYKNLVFTKPAVDIAQLLISNRNTFVEK